MSSVEQQIEAELSLSLLQYRQVLNHLNKIDEAIGTASSSLLRELCTSLMDLQNRAAQTDEILQQQLPRHSARTAALRSLEEDRRHLIAEIILVNRRVTTKAQGVKTFLAHEIGNLKTGLSAMNGYRQSQGTQGRIVNSAT